MVRRFRPALRKKFRLDTILSVIAGICLIGISCSCSHDKLEHHGNDLMEYSELLTIYDRGEYDEVFIANPDGKEVAHYVLVNDSVPDDTLELPEDATKIFVPMNNLIIDSEVYASVLEELGVADKIKGMYDTSFVTSPSLKAKIGKDDISDVGTPESPNIEKILSLEPQGIFVSYYDGMQTQGIDKLNVPVIKMYDIQESTPLGRAEWIKLIGILTGTEEKAESIFNAVEENYNNLRIREVIGENRPKIMTETPYNGSWYVPGGNSYQAILIKDAGGDYFKADDKSTGSLNLTIEQVAAEAYDSDIWLIKLFGQDLSYEKLKSENPIYTQLKPYKNRNIYFSNTLESGLFREFPFHPDLLLQDYKAIFSGDTVKVLRYFKKL